MELLKGAKSAVDFATYYPLLSKATVDNDTPIPGYLFEEIIKLSHHSPRHRQHLVNFLLSRLQSSSWSGKQKVIRILQHVCSRGHRGVRVYLRGKDGELRKAAASGGPPDPVLANTPQLFLSSAIQELLTLLFDPRTMKDDEVWMAGKDNSEEVIDNSEQSPIVQGYGSQAAKGKYEGFGSATVKQSDTLVDQVRGIVERVMSPSGDTKRLGMDFLHGEKGDYQPLSLPSLGSSVPCPPQPTLQPLIPVLSSSHPNKYKAHRSGHAGGGWESDEEIHEATPSPLNSEMDLSLALVDQQPNEDLVVGIAEEEFLNNLLEPKVTWPVDHDRLVELCQKCASFDLNILLGKIISRVDSLICGTSHQEVSQENDIPSDKDDGFQMASSVEKKLDISFHSKNVNANDTEPASTLSYTATRLLMLLVLVEFGIHYDIFPPNLVCSVLGKTFQNLHENLNLDSMVRIKAKKLSLITCKFV
ncbi:AP-4 complex accessory subunit Tepsin-like [Panulirus ornatus]|uniref:AP-4 complex accessory subunit Tepsin-like n=1 Tax=Panulirus ornatus TaxID=150431 RepID=UPI003A83700D